MAFSIRKMFSNISYFSKSGDQTSTGDYQRQESPSQHYIPNEPIRNTDFQAIEPDSTNSIKLPASIKENDLSARKLQSKSVEYFNVTKGSLSDTDLLSMNDVSKKHRLKKSLKLDIKKASQSMTDNLYHSDSMYIENTPKHILLNCKSADLFSETFRKLNFDRSFTSDFAPESSDDDIDIQSLSECSDTDVSIKNDADNSEIKMCRKVESKCESQMVPSATPESFGDVEVDKNEEERVSLLLNYQMKFEKIECILKKLLSEFQFHIEVSKIFNGRSIVTALPGADVSNIPKVLGQVTYMDNVSGETPSDSWNIVMEKEDTGTKLKFKKHLLSLKNCLDNFLCDYFHNADQKDLRSQKIKKCIKFDLQKGKQHNIKKLSSKKRIKHFDFPDYRDALLNLFHPETEIDELDTQLLQSSDECSQNCLCTCHNQSLSQSDSGLITKSDNFSNQSITSSIGNFSLDSTTLSAYSESLDQVISYNSFQDDSLVNTLLQKPAIERITFYVQVHSIQLKCDPGDNYESKNAISFYCPACEINENEENDLLTHILSQKHCEKIHFLYKTAYIKKCVANGKEIQPSTVLNPMRMYRDDNKIVCFGDAMYACSLCFENMIVGESILMAHCNDETHLERKDKLSEVFE